MENFRKVTVIANNSNVMHRHESASISIKSPTGRSIELKKRLLSDKRMTDQMREVFWKCAKDPMENFVGQVELSIDEMRSALEMSNF